MKKDFTSKQERKIKELFIKNKINKGKLFGNPSNGFIDFSNDENIKKLHAEAETPRPVAIDEAAAAWVAATRVAMWKELGSDFGGYKTGRILAYILDVLNEKIEESTASTIKVDVPLYEQCPIINSPYYGKTMPEILNKLADLIEHSCDYLKKGDK